ncbi:MAG: hypothetical protein HQL70_10790 [Magnetococcales bacterium]|nr:hypothetical protein [Magnetococcales bacterium]
MSALVSNLTSPVLFAGGDPARNAPDPAVADLANDIQKISNPTRLIEPKQVSSIQNTSRNPRFTPQPVAEKTARNSRDAREASLTDKISFTENSRIAVNPEKVDTPKTVAGLNLETRSEEIGNPKIDSQVDVTV